MIEARKYVAEQLTDGLTDRWTLYEYGLHVGYMYSPPYCVNRAYM